MKAVFTKILHVLFKRKRSFAAKSVNPEPYVQAPDYATSGNTAQDSIKRPAKKTTDVAAAKVANEAAIDKCQRILNYWLDAELFDIPDCPIYNEKDLLSIPLDDYDTIINQLSEQIKSGKQKINDKSRLLIMFQCHRAGYIAKNQEKHPNEEPPRTYLAAQALVPCWDDKQQQLTWIRSEEESDLIVNLAAIRTLYRRCPPPSSVNMGLSEWVEARVEHIENIMARWLQGDDNDTPLSSSALKPRLHEINRILAQEFWPHKQGKEFMLGQCQAIESNYQAPQDSLTQWQKDKIQDEKKYAPVIKKDGEITFRWRFCYYPEGLDKIQLGPFFVQDLETCIRHLNTRELNGLSVPLQRYLLGTNKQMEIPEAVNNGAFFTRKTNSLIKGRWPEKSEYGLSLLQSVAVNVALKAKDNPVVAVNGPPGTGKTTLLKDLIANAFVERSVKLSGLVEKNDWFDDKDVFSTVMSYSIVVASSNNKAVENISKELPAMNKIAKDYQHHMAHFSALAGEGDWGLFCAVLGNSNNRFLFKKILKKLKAHLKNTANVFQLNELESALRRATKKEAGKLISRFTERWEKDGHLSLLALDIQDSHAAKNRYSEFLTAFSDALIRIEKKDLSIESFAQSWNDFSDEQWAAAIEAIAAFKKQWFGAKKGDAYLAKKLKIAKQRFNEQYVKLNKADLRQASWQLNNSKYLTSPQHYCVLENESLEETEKRLQQGMPLGSKPLNNARTQLFITALKFNEALLNTVGKKIASDFDELEQLIEGRLESNERTPEHQKLWSRLFLFFPVVSTSLSSVENQFRLMQKTAGFGLAIVDEAGQAVNYHVTGLLQRSRQAIFVGDPIQLEPVVAFSQSVDLSVAEDFMPVSREEGKTCWGDNYLVSNSSAQTIADSAGNYMAKIGDRQVGIPLLVHRRCTEPMFSIANKIAYSDKMVIASQAFEWRAMQSGWINIIETSSELKKRGYYNEKEAGAALCVVKHLVFNEPQMLKDGVYIITPFTAMKNELLNQCKKLLKDEKNHQWLIGAFGQQVTDKKVYYDTISERVGTVHTFQGKEASTVILCCAASTIRNKAGGIGWVNSTPNLINVAVTRAKHHLFVLGNAEDWAGGNVSSELQAGGMKYYENIEIWQQESAIAFQEMSFVFNSRVKESSSDVSFSF